MKIREQFHKFRLKQIYFTKVDTSLQSLVDFKLSAGGSVDILTSFEILYLSNIRNIVSRGTATSRFQSSVLSTRDCFLILNLESGGNEHNRQM
jgi:hypothetical protein